MDYVLATGETHTVREFVENAFEELDIKLDWQGAGENEKGIDPISGKTLVEVSPEYFRPTEVDILLGDASKARDELSWSTQTSFEELVKIMVRSDWERVKRLGY